MVEESKRGGWQPGQSGNPAGRRPGASDVGKLRAAIAEFMPEIVDQLVTRAREGDIQAARLLLERVLPPVKAVESTIEIDLADGATLTEQGEAIVRAVAAGLIPPGQAGSLLTGLSNVARLKEIDDLTGRIEALEAGVMQ